MGPFEELETFCQLVRPLTRANSAYLSLNQLIRLTRVQDDKARRVLARLADAVGRPLVELRARRYVLTDAGRSLLERGEALLAVGQANGAEETVETVTVAVAARFDSGILVEPLREFFREWAGLVTVKVVLLDLDNIQHNRPSEFAFGLDWVTESPAAGIEPVDVPLGWSLLVPEAHRLASLAGQASVEDLGPDDRVFLAAGPGEALAATVLQGSLPANRVIVPFPEAVRRFVAAGLGLGLDIAVGRPVSDEPFLRLPLSGIEPARIGVHLPRKSELSEPAQALLALIRAHLQTVSKSAEDDSPPPAVPVSEEIAV